MLFEYVAWFRDPAMRSDDQEWPACFLIEAQSPEAALEWGDRLSRSRAIRASEIFLWSRIGPTSGDARLPIVLVGEEASDRKIGW